MRRKQNLRRLATETLEERRCLTASLGWDGPGQGSAELSYYVGSAPSGVSQQQFESTIETALQVWSDVIDVNFTQTSRAGQRDSLDFTSQNLDGAGGTLAQAYFPDDVNPARIAGDVQFDSSENWEVGNTRGRSAFDLLQVAVHEIGHALGIEHLEHSGSVLAPFISASQQFRSLSEHDVDAALSLYAPASTPVAPPQEEAEAIPADNPIEEEPESVGEEDTPNTNPNFRPWLRHWRLGNNWFRIGGRMIATPNQHNAIQPGDVNQDGLTTSSDALAIINFLLDPDNDQSTMLVDANNDGYGSVADALFVINEFSRINLGTPTPGAMTPDGPEAEDTDIPEVLSDPDVDTSIDVTPDANTEPEDTDTGDANETEADETDESETDDSDNTYNRSGLGWGLERLFDLVDDNDDGQITENETSSRLWRYVSVVDANNDGGITRQEIEDYVPNPGERRFNYLDQNVDGFITAGEVHESIWERISAADSNADTMVSFEELQAYRESQPSPVFRRLDNNDDGEITEDEVNRYVWRYLVMLDTDSSGSITPDESPAIGQFSFRSLVRPIFNRGFRFFGWHA